jgi:hypothetical protein
VTYGPLEGVLVFLCRTFTGKSLIMKGQGHLNLHLGHEANWLDDTPSTLWTHGDNIDDERCLWRHERISWRRKLHPLCSTFGLRVSKHHFLEYNILLGGLGFGDVGRFDDELTQIDEG